MAQSEQQMVAQGAYKIDKNIARHVLLVKRKHLSRMTTKVPNSVGMKKHDGNWHPFAKPFEKFQYPPVIAVSSTHH